MKAKFIGDPAEGEKPSIPDEIIVHGVTFERGKFSEIPAKLAAKFEGNSHFETKGASPATATASTDTSNEPVGLEAMTVPQLKALAEARGIDLGDATKKADIIAAIELATEADEAANV